MKNAHDVPRSPARARRHFGPRHELASPPRCGAVCTGWTARASAGVTRRRRRRLERQIYYDCATSVVPSDLGFRSCVPSGLRNDGCADATAAFYQLLLTPTQRSLLTPTRWHACLRKTRSPKDQRYAESVLIPYVRCLHLWGFIYGLWLRSGCMSLSKYLGFMQMRVNVYVAMPSSQN